MEPLQLNTADTGTDLCIFINSTFTGPNTQYTRPTPAGPAAPSTPSPTFPHRVLVVLDDPRQAEVGDLAHQGRRHQDVGGSKVSVDVVPPLDEGHAFCDLHPK